MITAFVTAAHAHGAEGMKELYLVASTASNTAPSPGRRNHAIDEGKRYLLIRTTIIAGKFVAEKAKNWLLSRHRSAQSLEGRTKSRKTFAAAYKA